MGDQYERACLGIFLDHTWIALASSASCAPNVAGCRPQAPCGFLHAPIGKKAVAHPRRPQTPVYGVASDGRDSVSPKRRISPRPCLRPRQSPCRHPWLPTRPWLTKEWALAFTCIPPRPHHGIECMHQSIEPRERMHVSITYSISQQ